MSVVDTLITARQGAADKLAAALAGDYSKAVELKPNFNAANGADRIAYVDALQKIIASTTQNISDIRSLEEDGPYLDTTTGCVT